MLGKQCQTHIANNAMFFEWGCVNSQGLNSIEIRIKNKANDKYKKDPHVLAGLLLLVAHLFKFSTSQT
jgi:hypothetical protein